MKLICIEDSACYTDPNAGLVKKGKIYTHEETYIEHEIRGSCIWYKVEEIPKCHHHSSLFIEIDEDMIQKLTYETSENTR